MIYLILLAVIVLDQASKYMVRMNIMLGDTIPLIDNFLNITYVRNTGGAFSLLSGRLFVLIPFTILVIILMLAFLIKEQKKLSLGKKISSALVISGGIGNLIDRMVLGYVTDFIDVWKWPVFNIADISITVGCLLLIIFIIAEDSGGKKSEGEGKV